MSHVIALTALVVAASLAAVLTVSWLIERTGFLGICPYPHDPRAYAQQGCFTNYVEGATTLDGALAHYEVPMPASATAVRFYLDPGAFNGGDAFYLKFSASVAQMRGFLTALDAKRSSGAGANWQQQSAGYDDGVVPWTFDSSYSVYSFTRTIGPSSDREYLTGTVILSAAMTTAYVVVDD